MFVLSTFQKSRDLVITYFIELLKNILNVKWQSCYPEDGKIKKEQRREGGRWRERGRETSNNHVSCNTKYLKKI